jgi:hypothetical protein
MLAPKLLARVLSLDVVFKRAIAAFNANRHGPALTTRNSEQNGIRIKICETFSRNGERPVGWPSKAAVLPEDFSSTALEDRRTALRENVT